MLNDHSYHYNKVDSRQEKAAKLVESNAVSMIDDELRICEVILLALSLQSHESAQVMTT